MAIPRITGITLQQAGSTHGAGDYLVTLSDGTTLTLESGDAVVRALAAAGTPAASSAGAIAYRSGVTAPDQAAAPRLGTTAIEAGGSLVDGTTYYSKVAGHTAAGNTTATGGTARAAGTGTGTLRIPITANASPLVIGYDVYCSEDVDPLFVGRISETQRAAGCVITVAADGATPATVTAGGVPGAVDVQVPGTGAASDVTRAVNTAWILPAGVDPIACDGFANVDFYLNWTEPVGDQSATQPTLIVAGALLDDAGGLFYLAAPATYDFGGQTPGVLTGRTQVYSLACHGAAHAQLLVLALTPADAGVAVNIRAVRS